MKVFVIKHTYDNGEWGEDYRSYENWKLFSTVEKALASYCDSIIGGYEGGFSLIGWELDTQKQEILEESPWHECSSYYEETYSPEEKEYYEEMLQKLQSQEEYNDYDGLPHPMNSIYEYWKYEDLCTPHECWLDDIVESFCKEYNDHLTDYHYLINLVKEYNSIFEKLGYSNAWKAYKERLEIPHKIESDILVDELLDDLNTLIYK